ncbi:MAG: glycosyltransferase family 39 protein [Clostridium sp.]|nr:glycosyltransferase family 39 protein [Acetatifactor muris]MCM1526371.1 glycosyltransferase family 39 protein [Bacteroides sp.]MCM1564003.1 glycosyltransferase family 39 protein [Clostridium sp.]
MRKWLERYISVILWVAILFAFLFTRMWRLTDIPAGLHLDEAGMAYDAWCLSQYGVDRHLNSWPVYLLNFGGGQSILYAYLLAGLFKLFGFHAILIRIPGVFFSLLALIFTMAASRILFPDNKYAPYIAGALVVICPYYIMAGRLGLDCNLMLGCAAVFFYCLLKALESEKRTWYLLAGLSGGIMLYSYVLSYLILPLFLILVMVCAIWTRRFSLGKWALMAVSMGLLAAPLILEQVVNVFGLEQIRLGIFTITKMDSYRASEFGTFSLNSLRVALRDIFVGDMWRHNSVPGFYNLYRLSVPLAIAGAVRFGQKCLSSLRRREMDPTALVLGWFFAVLFVVCHIYPCINQVNSIFFAYTLLTVEGIHWLTGLGKIAGKICAAAVSLIFVICFVGFGRYYYGGAYVAENHPMPYFDILIPEAVEFIEDHPQYGVNGAQTAEHTIYLALSSLRSPYELRLINDDPYVLDYYHCSYLGEIEDGYYYIVRNIFPEYSDELRMKGYTEIVYGDYSLFYRE